MLVIHWKEGSLNHIPDSTCVFMPEVWPCPATCRLNDAVQKTMWWKFGEFSWEGERHKSPSPVKFHVNALTATCVMVLQGWNLFCVFVSVFLGLCMCVCVCVCVCVSAVLEGHKQCAAVLWHKVYCWLHYIRYFRLLSSHLFLSHRWTVWMWIAQKTSSLHQDWLRWATWAAISAAALDPSPNTSVPFVGTELQVQQLRDVRCCILFWFGLELSARYISISSEVQYGCVCREALWCLQLWRLQRLL